MMTFDQLAETLNLAFQLRVSGVPEEQIPIHSVAEMRRLLEQINKFKGQQYALPKAAKTTRKLTRYSQNNLLYSWPFYNNPTSDKYVPPEASMPINEIENIENINEPPHDVPIITEEDKVDTASEEIESLSPIELAKKIEKIVSMMGDDGIDEHLAAAAAKLTARLLNLLEEIAGITTQASKTNNQEANEQLTEQAARLRSRLIKVAKQAADLQLSGLSSLLKESSKHCTTIIKNSCPANRANKIAQNINTLLSPSSIRLAARNKNKKCLLRQKILDLLDEYGQLQSIGLAKKLQLPKRSVQRLLNIMKQDNEVIADEVPVFGRGRGRSGRLVLWKKPIPITANKLKKAQTATEVPLNQACPRCGGQIAANQTEGFLFCTECGARYELSLENIE